MTSRKPRRPHEFTGRTLRRSRRPMLGGLGAAIVSMKDNHPLTHTDRRACADHRQLPASHRERLRATDGRRVEVTLVGGRQTRQLTGKGAVAATTRGREGRRPGRARQPVLPWHRRAVDGARRRARRRAGKEPKRALNPTGGRTRRPPGRALASQNASRVRQTPLGGSHSLVRVQSNDKWRNGADLRPCH